jgi:hypothetical protein
MYCGRPPPRRSLEYERLLPGVADPSPKGLLELIVSEGCYRVMMGDVCCLRRWRNSRDVVGRKKGCPLADLMSGSRIAWSAAAGVRSRMDKGSQATTCNAKRALRLHTRPLRCGRTSA